MISIDVNDIVRLKKKHPCGSYEWRVLRIGTDLKIECMGCGHRIMVARSMVEKNMRNIRKSEA